MPTSGAYTIDVGGIEREYLLHVPDDVSAGSALVLVLHGYTDTAANVAAYTDFDAVADAEGFVVAYPQGTVDDLGATFFDVGYAFHERRVDDVGFLRALAVDLVERLDLDPESVFVTGMSNGGDMAYVLVCSDQSWVAAVAPVAGMMLESVAAGCSPTSRTSVLEIHGTADQVTFWDGDPGNVGGWGAYLSQMAAMQFLAEEYGLEQTVEAPIPELSEAWDRPVVATRWSTAVDDTEVTLLRIEGGAHVWPGVEASGAVWDFFDSHRP
jgi:polyhydroxybutyrate depolymerase